MNKNKTEFIRVEKNRNYTVIHNEFLRRDDLSWKAKGILAYVLSLPDDWNINLGELMKHATDGERSFRSGWDELTKKGYVDRKPVRDGNRIKYWETIVRESVDTTASAELCGFVDVQSVDVQSVDVQNVELLSTKDTKYLKELSTERTKDTLSDSNESDEIPYKRIVDYLNEKTGSQYRHTTKATQTLIRARWNEGFKVREFEKVIDNKVSDWLNDSKMSEYLRPQTLFGTKFESYLNQSLVNNNETRGGGEYDDLF